ncbi:hypothetical protein PTKIN_Ptkin10aG0006600 [Pterospermum kingtungense]
MASGSGELSLTAQIDDYETLISMTDVELLKRAWPNEKAAPEILPFDEALVKRAKEQIELMVLFINLKTISLCLFPEKTSSIVNKKLKL